MADGANIPQGEAITPKEWTEIEAAAKNFDLRPSIKARLVVSSQLPETSREPCSICAKVGLWVADAPRPLVCHNCLEVVDE